jgi:hypothetical protein
VEAIGEDEGGGESAETNQARILRGGGSMRVDTVEGRGDAVEVAHDEERGGHGREKREEGLVEERVAVCWLSRGIDGEETDCMGGDGEV